MSNHNVVETTFLGKDKLSGVLNTIGKSSGSANRELLGMAKNLLGLAAGYASVSYMKNLSSGIMKVGQEAEQAKISLAGILSGQGMAKDFNAGLTMAATTLAQIEKDAAALPGSAQEFQMAFQTSAAAIGTSGMKLKEFIGLSNKMTAVAKIFGEDSAQAGRDISLLVEGRAGMDVTLWTKLAPYMGMAVSDAAKFNKLAPEKRMEKLVSVVGDGVKNQGKLGDMITAYGDTWDAISSTIDSSMAVLWRTGTAPLFEKAKANAKVIMGWLEKNEGTLKMLATGAGEKVASIMTPAAAVGMAGSILGKVAFGFGPVGMAISALAAKAAVGGKDIDQLGESSYRAVQKLTDFIGVLSEKVTPSLTSLADSVVDLFIDMGPSLAEGLNLLASGLKGAADALGWFISSKKDPKDPGFLARSEAIAKMKADEALGEGSHGIFGTAGARFSTYTGMVLGEKFTPEQEAKIDEILTQMQHRTEAEDYNKLMTTGSFAEASKYARDHLYGFKMKMGDEGYAQVLQKVGGKKYVTDHDMDLARYDEDMVMGRYKEIVDAMANAGAGTAEGIKLAQQASDYMSVMMSDYLYDIFMSAPELLTAEGIMQGALEGILAEEDAAYDAMFNSAGGGGAVEQVVPKKPSINQDFRHSRFDIRQEFPDGTDPDRVAVAFRRDISDLAVRKLGTGVLGGVFGL